MNLAGKVSGVSMLVGGDSRLNTSRLSGSSLSLQVNENSDVLVGGNFSEISIAANGSSTLVISGEASQRLSLALEGGTTATGTGQTHDFSLREAGSSTGDFSRLIAQTASVQAFGSSSVKLVAAKSLSAVAAGSSTISYKGNPQGSSLKSVDSATIHRA